jgi:DNA-binding CsgD family transcriptional regulator
LRDLAARAEPVPADIVSAGQWLQLLCKRLSNSEIADQRYIGTRTVEFHVTNGLGRLGAEHRCDAAAIAVRLGLI